MRQTRAQEGNGVDVQHPKKECGKCGRIHNGECRQGRNICFGCRKRRYMVKNYPHNWGQARGNAQPRCNPQNIAAVEPPKRNKIYSLKGREEQEKFAIVVTGMLQIFSTLFMIYLIQRLRFLLQLPCLILLLKHYLRFCMMVQQLVLPQEKMYEIIQFIKISHQQYTVRLCRPC